MPIPQKHFRQLCSPDSAFKGFNHIEGAKMSVADAHDKLDLLVSKTKVALDLWMNNPQSKALQEEFREANLALLEFSRSQKEASH